MSLPRRQWKPGVRVHVGFLVLAGLCLTNIIRADQTPAPAQTPASPQPSSVVQEPVTGERLIILAGRSMVLTTDFDIKRIKITNSDVADAMAVTARELVIDGKSPGTISLIVW